MLSKRTNARCGFQTGSLTSVLREMGMEHPNCCASAPKSCFFVTRLAQYREWFDSGCRSNVSSRSLGKRSSLRELASSTWVQTWPLNSNRNPMPVIKMLDERPWILNLSTALVLCERRRKQQPDRNAGCPQNRFFLPRLAQIL